MVTYSKITAVCVIAACLSSFVGLGGMASAQALQPPAELPPEGFAGTQFVDSRGCVYIRAGLAGAVTWVPRVTRDREQVCGFVPSFPEQAAAAAPAPTPPPPPAATPTPAAPKVVVLGAATATPSLQPAAPAPVRRTVPSAAPVAQPAAGTPITITPDTRILPRHLYEQRQLERPVRTPKGYRSAWKDGRLNTRRAEQTLAGQAQMRQVWTDTVPRRLISDR